MNKVTVNECITLEELDNKDFDYRIYGCFEDKINKIIVDKGYFIVNFRLLICYLTIDIESISNNNLFTVSNKKLELDEVIIEGENGLVVEISKSLIKVNPGETLESDDTLIKNLGFGDANAECGIIIDFDCSDLNND